MFVGGQEHAPPPCKRFFFTKAKDFHCIRAGIFSMCVICTHHKNDDHMSLSYMEDQCLLVQKEGVPLEEVFKNNSFFFVCKNSLYQIKKTGHMCPSYMMITYDPPIWWLSVCWRTRGIPPSIFVSSNSEILFLL
jgi:hypothetical protein